MNITVRYSREDKLYTVCIAGSNDRGSDYVSLADFDKLDEAARYIHWLNGGNSLEAFKENGPSRSGKIVGGVVHWDDEQKAE